MEDSFLKKLKEAGDSSQTLFLRLLQEYKLSEKSLHLFIEGNDDPAFYTNYISNLAGNNFQIYFYNSKNKSGVYSNYNQISWKSYNKNRVLFFVDKDYSDILKLRYPIDQNIFVTKYYSIENYLVNDQIVRRILTDLVHITDPSIINNIIKKFHQEHKSFCEYMVLLSAWIIYHRKNGTNINLGNISLSHIFQFNAKLEIVKLNSPQGKKLLDYLDEKTGNPDSSGSWKSVRKIYSSLLKINEDKIHLRGKFEIWFLVAFINALIDNLNSSRKKGEPKAKMNVSLSSSNAVALLATRLSIPPDLKSFISNNLSKIN
ncbi:DUF4435 domain-containing protein [Christiangramia sp. OXR-203]|uniref:DUF4435 domain-containing protein n=1 Tax=Christiangramia sp. OXR-203 TaxID=3100176 RepID=UPI002AC96F31|nr:DUF4435 domain-containing protein [Christiangramia sp. OXR-203]WPY97639.1 DUF4435 domain-containing protein [Christiangramia sp. OXR-203]